MLDAFGENVWQYMGFLKVNSGGITIPSNLVGVQPMTGPVGIPFALKFKMTTNYMLKYNNKEILFEVDEGDIVTIHEDGTNMKYTKKHARQLWNELRNIGYSQ